MIAFTAEVYQNEYLNAGADEVHAIVTVTAADTGPTAGTGGAGGAAANANPGSAAEIIIVDVSGSMEAPHSKMRAARRATAAAIDQISDGVWFAIVVGNTDAHIVFPTARHDHSNGFVQASTTTRDQAKHAVRQMQGSGGTAISTWLSLANDMFRAQNCAISHAILLTDGRNESEHPHLLDEVVARCAGAFQCDARGVGTDWDVAELRSIADALLGTVDIIPDPEEMEEEFKSLIDTAMRRQVADVRLRVWAPQAAVVQYVKQVAPTLEDLTGKAMAGPNPLTRDYPTGAWGDDTRDYHVCVRVKPGAVGDEMLAARLSLVVDGTAVSQGLVKAIWTEDEQLSARIDASVAHYTGQAELAKAIAEGLAARKAGDDATATAKLGRATQLATESGHENTIKLLAKVVDIDDAETGTVRLKKEVATVDEMALDTRSTKTTRVKK